MPIDTVAASALHQKVKAGAPLAAADIHAVGVSPADLQTALTTGLNLQQILALIVQYGQQFITILPIILQVLSLLGGGTVPPVSIPGTKP